MATAMVTVCQHLWGVIMAENGVVATPRDTSFTFFMGVHITSLCFVQKSQFDKHTSCAVCMAPSQRNNMSPMRVKYHSYFFSRINACMCGAGA